MASTPTLRRLNDRERYWNLTWPQWAGLAVAGGVLYGAVKFSPLGTRATVTIVLLVLLAAGMVVMGVSGQALSPGRQLRAISRYHRHPKTWTLPERPGRSGLVLDRAPQLASDEAPELGSAPALDQLDGLEDPGEWL